MGVEKKLTSCTPAYHIPAGVQEESGKRGEERNQQAPRFMRCESPSTNNAFCFLHCGIIIGWALPPIRLKHYQSRTHRLHLHHDFPNLSSSPALYL